MRRIRLYSNLAFATAICHLLVPCAGCWEKIEYKAPRTAAGPPKAATENPPSAEPEKSPASPPEVEKQVAKPSVEGPASASSPPLSQAPVVAEPSAPKQADNLYSNSETPAEEPKSNEKPTASSSAESSPATVGDRYATSSATMTTPSEAQPSRTGSTTTASSTPTTTEATPSSPPPAAATASTNQSTTSQAAWLLGSRLSLAALAHDRGVAAKNVPVWFADAQSAATLLGTTIGELPEPAAADDTSPASRQVVNYLLVNGQRVGRELAKQHGTEQSALFEIALKSNLLLLLYTPGTSAGDSIATAISKAAPQAKLPSEFWQPLVDALNKRASQADVRAAVRKMHGEIERFLARPTGASSK